jgi:hypothetical protein
MKIIQIEQILLIKVEDFVSSTALLI